MLERIENYFLEQPNRLIALGRILAEVGGGLLVFAAIGRVVVLAPGVISSMGGVQEASKTLAEIYPTLPTWWVPESIVGSLFALAIFFLGWWLAATGHRFRRFLGS